MVAGIIDNMGWASGHIARLRNGETISFRPRGNSMTGKVNDGDLVTIEPVVEATLLEVGDVVLCKVNGHEHLHLIRAMRDGQCMIANAKGHINGWCSRASVYGRCVKVES